ncbi:MAG TPA: hypothetical protein VGF14_05985 [Alphaproteobacteria bacterium]
MSINNSAKQNNASMTPAMSIQTISHLKKTIMVPQERTKEKKPEIVNASALDSQIVASIMNAKDVESVITTNGSLISLETAYGDPQDVIADMKHTLEAQKSAAGYTQMIREPRLTVVTLRENSQDIIDEQKAILEEMLPSAKLIEHKTTDGQLLLNVAIDNRDHIVKSEGEHKPASAVYVALMVSNLVGTQEKRDENLRGLLSLVA